MMVTIMPMKIEKKIIMTVIIVTIIISNDDHIDINFFKKPKLVSVISILDEVTANTIWVKTNLVKT